MQTGPTASRTRFGELPFARRPCAFPKTSSDRDSRARAQLRRLGPLASTRCQETRARTTRVYLPAAPERSGPGRYTHHPDIPRRPERGFLPIALRSRNWWRSVRKNQPVDEGEIARGRSSDIRLASTNSENLVSGKTGARCLRWRADWNSVLSRIVPVGAPPDGARHSIPSHRHMTTPRQYIGPGGRVLLPGNWARKAMAVEFASAAMLPGES